MARRSALKVFDPARVIQRLKDRLLKLGRDLVWRSCDPAACFGTTFRLCHGFYSNLV